jgi:predicted Na+-dependent transporter
VLEGIFSAILAAYAWRITARRGVSLHWPAIFLGVLFILMSPWLSPTKFIATLPEPYTHLLLGLLITLGFLAPGAVFALLVTRAQRKCARPSDELGIDALVESEQSAP